MAYLKQKISAALTAAGLPHKPQTMDDIQNKRDLLLDFLTAEGPEGGPNVSVIVKEKGDNTITVSGPYASRLFVMMLTKEFRKATYAGNQLRLHASEIILQKSFKTEEIAGHLIQAAEAIEDLHKTIDSLEARLAGKGKWA